MLKQLDLLGYNIFPPPPVGLIMVLSYEIPTELPLIGRITYIVLAQT